MILSPPIIPIFIKGLLSSVRTENILHDYFLTSAKGAYCPIMFAIISIDILFGYFHFPIAEASSLAGLEFSQEMGTNRKLRGGKLMHNNYKHTKKIKYPTGFGLVTPK